MGFPKGFHKGPFCAESNLVTNHVLSQPAKGKMEKKRLILVNANESALFKELNDPSAAHGHRHPSVFQTKTKVEPKVHTTLGKNLNVNGLAEKEGKKTKPETTGSVF